MNSINLQDHIQFTDSQKRATYEALRHRFCLFGGIRGPGKSFWCRWFCVLFLLSLAKFGIRGARGNVYALTYPVLREMHIDKFIREAEFLGTWHDGRHEFAFFPEYGGHILAFRNLDDPKKKKGGESAISAIDELTNVPHETFTYIRGNLRWPGVEHPRLIAASNPDGDHANWVRQVYIEKRPITDRDRMDQYVFVPAPFRDNPHIAQSYYDDIECIPEPLRSAWTKGDWYTDQVDRDWQVFSAKHVRAAMDRWREAVKAGNIPDTVDTWGADFSDGGLDSGVFTPCVHDFAIEQIVSREHAKGQQDLLGHLLRTRGGTAHCDVIGVGAGIYRNLAEMDDISVYGVNFAERSHMYDRSGVLPFSNLRAQYYWTTREMLESRDDGTGCAIPDDPELYHDLTAVNWKMTTSGIQIEEKKKIKELLGRSPDKGDSLVLGLGGLQGGVSAEWV